MKKQMIFAFPGNEKMAENLANRLNIDLGELEIRAFPDGESYVRIRSEVNNKIVFIVCTLDHPNHKILSLMFMAKTLKVLGAKKVGLIAPYLSYMRQDKRFHPGEAITASLFASYLSTWLDALITVDPHLHRIKHLGDIYSIPSLKVLHANEKIAEWIIHHVDSPLLIGPDEESRQWLTEIAKYANADFIICKKTRLSEGGVNIMLPDINNTNKIPIIIDDIISSGASMMATLLLLSSRGFKYPICIGIHALFNEVIEKKLWQAGATNIVTCNTILHSSNQIDLTDIFVKKIPEVFQSD